LALAANVLPVIEQRNAAGATSLRAIARGLNAARHCNGSRRRLDAGAGHRRAAAGFLTNGYASIKLASGRIADETARAS
jgi:hypothetical protein